VRHHAAGPQPLLAAQHVGHSLGGRRGALMLASNLDGGFPQQAI
jgi:hypothetical protein